MINFFKIILCALIIFIANNTINAQSTNKLIKTFWVGDKGTMYFLNPMKFSVDNKKYLLADFTFTEKNQDSIIINISVVNSIIPKKIDSIFIESNNVQKRSLSEISLFYKEKKGKKYISRYTSKLDFKTFIEILDNAEWKFIINNEDYLMSKKTNRIAKKIKENLFFLFE